jgi:hypothetical protein
MSNRTSRINPLTMNAALQTYSHGIMLLLASPVVIGSVYGMFGGPKSLTMMYRGELLTVTPILTTGLAMFAGIRFYARRSRGSETWAGYIGGFVGLSVGALIDVWLLNQRWAKLKEI